MKSDKYTKYLLITVVALTILLMFTRGLTYAKYVSNKVLNYYLSSKEFYFESDLLDVNKVKNSDTSWDGSSVKFNLLNYENKLLASGYDIKYEVECTVLEENTTKRCVLNGTNTNKIIGTLSKNYGCINQTKDGVDTKNYGEEMCNKEKYTWTSLPTNKEFYFDIVDDKEITSANVLITAKSTSPYQKTLTGEFLLTKDNSELGSLKHDLKINDTYNTLTVTNSYNEDKCIKLSWDSKDLIFDNTNNNYYQTNTDISNNINEVIFKLNKKDSINYTFYTNNKDKTITNNDFKLVESTLCK